ncbi:glycosyltransferase family 4 protein [Agromyces sp. SYSU T00266]|uniref:glycosyltransferase family 4 protein n=1 Tax=Agromyces zhanjiangensis TaxID=3158562 RepID=UPI003396D7C5
MIGIVHAITPGDHFSPRTGSAIPTVVHALASAAVRDAGAARHAVLVDRSTMHPRYDSAELIEYDRTTWLTGRDRVLDLARGRVGLARRGVERFYAPLVDAVRERPQSFVLAHNAPVIPWMLRDSEHRVVLYAHNDLLRTYSRAEASRMLGPAAAIVCVGDELAETTQAALPPHLSARVHVVRNGIDTDRFQPGVTSRGREGNPVEPFRAMFVGRVIPEKGPDVLVRAAGLLPPGAVEVVIVGSRGFARDAPLSPYEEKLRRLADESGATVRFEAFVDRERLPALLRSAKVLVVPSTWAEPSGLTAGEGMASGLPVVASRVGGLPDVVGDAGILVPPNDPVALAGALRRLIDDHAERARRGAASRAYAEAHDWDWAWWNLRHVLDGL